MLPRPHKIDSREKLKAHINDIAEKTNTGFTFDVFEQSVLLGATITKMAQRAGCDFKTMKKWVDVYKGDTHASR